MRHKDVFAKSKKTYVPYMFIAPFLIIFTAFFTIPSIYSLVLSFFQYRGYGAARFIGLKNYIAIFQYSYFYSTLYNVLFYYLIHTLPMLLISFLLAYSIKSKYARFTQFYKSAIFLPQILALVCTALVFRIIFAANSGVINSLLGTNIKFLEHPILMKLSVIVMIMWRATGWYMVIYLSGLTNLDNSVLESAVVDGVNAVQKIWYIVLPLMKPIILMSFVLETIGSLKLSVEPNMLISGWLDAPESAATAINVVLNNIRGGNFGMACAAGWILMVIILMVTILQLKLSSKEE